MTNRAREIATEMLYNALESAVDNTLAELQVVDTDDSSTLREEVEFMICDALIEFTLPDSATKHEVVV